jgi:hypothetical protein
MTTTMSAVEHRMENNASSRGYLAAWHPGGDATNVLRPAFPLVHHAAAPFLALVTRRMRRRTFLTLVGRRRQRSDPHPYHGTTSRPDTHADPCQ